MKFLEHDETLESDQFRVSWRKSTTVEKDLFLDMEDFTKKFQGIGMLISLNGQEESLRCKWLQVLMICLNFLQKTSRLT